jgi:hypothetical protein
MPATFFLVRAVVAEPLREKFDHWTSTCHLLWALAMRPDKPVELRPTDAAASIH